jgi:hypothetical protein
MTSAPRLRALEPWPELPLEAWQATRDTLHLWTQLVGKTRLALSPSENHWWHVALNVTARGLGTPPMPCGGRTLEIEFDFLEKSLVARTSEGRTESIPLAPQSVAAFYKHYRAMLHALDVECRIRPVPTEVADPIPFHEDREHAAFDAGAARRFFEALAQADRVMRVFRGRFVGKSSPVHFWWGGFDLACTRFSGRKAPPHPGGVPNVPDVVAREAYSHECISLGWWPGGAPVLEPAFYAYAYPEPPGCPEAAIGPSAASYHPGLREWILPYEAVRRAPDPEAAVLEFAQSTYEAAATLGRWDRAGLERRPPAASSP